eukprot:6884644-Pyramimonas_sp.AAC.1
MQHSAAVVSTPEELSDRDVSDHAAVRVTLSNRRQRKKYIKTAPPAIYKSVGFCERLGRLLDYEQHTFCLLSPPRQMERYKELVNVAALDSLNQ